jgi:adenosylcobinamide-phosphate synthase
VQTLSFVCCLGLVVVLAVDQLWGEPAARWHPVVWMGRYLDWAANRFAPQCAQSGDDLRDFCLGALYWCIGALIFTVPFWFLQESLYLLVLHSAKPWQVALSALAIGLALKPLLALAMLCNEVRAVEAALGESLEAGRGRLAWLVSRDTTQLSAEEVRESAIESLAENFNDSVVAPIFWFVLLGLPGAALYRFANTVDAMWGYPAERAGRYWQWAGKWAARADDVLSWVPARLAAGLILLMAPSAWHHSRAIYHASSATPSPNSGWPMAAMAFVLGVRLGKPGVYTLNAAAPAPLPDDTHRAIASIRNTLVLQLVFAFTAIYSIALWR